jgi:hypothetical protein
VKTEKEAGMEETVREIIRRRDDADDDTIWGMFEALADAIGAGDDPEDALAEEFGLEPDYLLDDEVMAAVEEGFSIRVALKAQARAASPDA